MDLSKDKRSARLTIDAQLTASELETLIGELLITRAHMNPPVPYEQPHATDDTNASIQNDPYFHLGVRADGRLYMWFRNAGLGWLTFVIPAAKVPAIRDYLVANVAVHPKDGEFFLGKKVPDGNTPH